MNKSMEEMIMPCILPLCPDCINFLRSKEDSNVCKAFPDGIPDNYFWYGINAKKSVECKNGFKFENRLKIVAKKEVA